MEKVVFANKIDFSILRHPVTGKSYIQVYPPVSGNEMEIMEWFEGAEEKLSMEALDTEQRLGVYISFLSALTGIKSGTSVGNYVAEPMGWEDAVNTSVFQWKENCLQGKDSFIQTYAARVMGVQGKEDGAWEKLIRQEAVKASVFDMEWLSAEDVIKRMNDRYLGLESIMPALRYSNPTLYGLLQKENGKDESIRYGMASLSFLLRGRSREELQKAEEELKENAWESGGLVERIPLEYTSGMKETEKTISMFGGGTFRQHRYRNLISEEEMGKFLYLQKENSTDGESRYLEEMRSLFFGKSTAEGGESRK